MDERILHLFSFHEPLIWVAISLVTSLAFWLVHYRLTAQQQYIINSARWVLIPYIGLLLGHLSPRLLGLTEINWLSSLSLGIGLICLTTLLTLIVQTTIVDPNALHTSPKAAMTSTKSFAESIVSAGAEQFHWSFLRGALWETLLRVGYSATTAAYAAIWIGGLLAALELLIHKRQGIPRLVSLLTLTLTSILFFFTRNFWLCWILHLLTTTMLQTSATTTNLEKQITTDYAD